MARSSPALAGLSQLGLGEYLAGYLPGVINVPILELDGFLARAHATRAQPLVLVCAAGVNAALAIPTVRLYKEA